MSVFLFLKIYLIVKTSRIRSLYFSRTQLSVIPQEISQIASSTHDIKLGEKALGRFFLALDRNDIGQLLKDQLEAAVGEEKYPILLGLLYNDIYVRFIDLMVDNAKKYASEV